jgi:hypothetical protein
MSSIGYFVLLEAPTRKKELYPAEIVSRAVRSPLVEVRWYHGNVFPQKSHPGTFHVPVSICMEALFCDIGEAPNPVRLVNFRAWRKLTESADGKSPDSHSRARGRAL